MKCHGEQCTCAISEPPSNWIGFQREGLLTDFQLYSAERTGPIRAALQDVPRSHRPRPVINSFPRKSGSCMTDTLTADWFMSCALFRRLSAPSHKSSVTT